ncbi:MULTISPECIES: phospholipase D family protein [Weeksellaceae]|uniref:phospholipase D family protein n=1 Tax=Weeksellaceae TaxID=2762318 RepID=UPI00076483C4|nr:MULTISPECIES: phospholipase D family protein [Weeksellaceae]MDE5518185.1 phospholipase D family protein [Elizabethkingia meningoseptica]
MKLITTPKDLNNNFKRLIKNYNFFKWATAWASTGNEISYELLKNRHKIVKITVGIHFYQTHPNFIKEFIEDPAVHFLEQPDGTFHPKVYLFSNDENNWELIIGSANFTTSAFSKNCEVCVLVTSKDSNANELYKTTLQLIDESFEYGKTFSELDWENYNKIWNIQQSKLNSLSGQYGASKDKPKPIHKIELQTKSWDQFVVDVYKKGSRDVRRRIKVIEIARELFSKAKHFNELDDDERKFIAGIPNNLLLKIEGAEDWAFFGSMKGAGKFKKQINDNSELISRALDQIPLNGQITKMNYDNFLEYFQMALPGNYLATSTRLLAMKRPDIFICYDSKNNYGLCKDFSITRNGMDNERYWNEIILRVYDSEWWQKPNPKNEMETKISLARSAFLDSLYYEG